MSIVKAIAVLLGAVVILGLLNLATYLHKDLTTPMHCRCGARPALEN